MTDKIFGLLHLSSRTIHTNDKGDIFKKFTPFFSHIKPFDVKTKKKTLSDVFCTVSITDKTVLEYHDNISSDNIPLILTKLNWKNCLKKDFISDLDDIISIDLTPERTNLESFTSYTIDPEGSLDRDDAIGIDILNKRIFIHIADPSSYVSKDSFFDKELSNRVQSIYLDKVFHMFPEPFSTKIISLTEGNKNRAFTLELSYNDSYEIVSHRFYKSYIQVKNLTYEEAERIILDKSNQDLVELYKFGLNHSKIDSKLYDSHKMVEIYMILCNKFASLEMKDVISIVRYNNTPKIDLTNVDKSIDSNLIDMYVISNNEAASYEINTEYTGHTLLNLDYYTHFSSPLRRYIDLVLHRILYQKISSNENTPNGVNLYTESELKDICKNVNNITKNYKMAYNIDKLNKIMKDKTTLEIECNLVYIGENIIKLYYKENNLLLFVNLIHSKIKNNVNININPNELHITNDYDEIINLKLFQIVKVKIFKLKNSIKPYQISLTDPVLDLF